MPDRIIKESCCTSDTLSQLTDFEERFWWRLTVNCDDFGRCDARPAILKSKLFPLVDGKTHKDMQKALTALASVGLVMVYEVDGRPFLQVVKWDKHQRIRAKRSKFPSPDKTCCHLTADADICSRNPIQSNPIRIQSESNAKANARDVANMYLFAEFWNAYPESRKIGKDDAWEAWMGLDPTPEMATQIIDNLEAWKKSRQWTSDNGAFIPAPKNFLDPERGYVKNKPAPAKQDIPKGASGELGEAELEAIQRVLSESESDSFA